MERKSDWPPVERLSNDGARQVQDARAAAHHIIQNAGNAGLAMRGVITAVADGFEPEYLERGLENTLRAVRNAFADRSARDIVAGKPPA